MKIKFLYVWRGILLLGIASVPTIVLVGIFYIIFGADSARTIPSPLFTLAMLLGGFLMLIAHSRWVFLITGMSVVIPGNPQDGVGKIESRNAKGNYKAHFPHTDSWSTRHFPRNRFRTPPLF